MPEIVCVPISCALYNEFSLRCDRSVNPSGWIEDIIRDYLDRTKGDAAIWSIRHARRVDLDEKVEGLLDGFGPPDQGYQWKNVFLRNGSRVRMSTRERSTSPILPMASFDTTTNQCRRLSLRLLWRMARPEMHGAIFGSKSLNKRVTLGGKELTEYVRDSRIGKGGPMGNLYLTDHILHRIRQRGLKESDLAFVVKHGSTVADGVYLRDQDAQTIIEHAKARIALATRLRRTYVVLDGSDLVTSYRPARKTERKILRTMQD